MFITVMADSRAVELYTNGNVYRISSEHENKILQLSDNVFLTIIGIAEDAKDFIDRSNLQQAVLENGKLKSNYEIMKWFNSCKHQLITNDFGFSLSFGGLTIEDNLKVFTIESNEKKLEELAYGKDTISYVLYPSRYIDPDFAYQLFNNLYRNCDGTPESMIQIQAKLNDSIADIDISVNKNKKWFCFRPDVPTENGSITQQGYKPTYQHTLGQ
jgi:hypothetical protein